MMAVGAALVLLVAFILVATVELDPPGLAVIVLVGLLGLALFLSVGGVAAAAFALKRGGTPVNLLAVVVGAVGIAVSVYALGILATAFGDLAAAGLTVRRTVPSHGTAVNLNQRAAPQS